MQLVSRQANDYYDVPKERYIRVLNVALEYLQRTYGQDPLTTYDLVIKAIASLLNKINQNTSGRLYISKTLYDLYGKAIYLYVEHKSEISPTIEHDKNKLLEYAKLYKQCYYSNNKNKAKKIDNIVDDIDKVDGLSNNTWKKISTYFMNMSVTISTSFDRNNLNDDKIESNFQAIRKIINPLSVSKDKIIQCVYNAYHGFINCDKSVIKEIIAKIHNFDAVDELTDKDFSEVKGQFNFFIPDISFSEFLGSGSISGQFLKKSIKKLSKILDTDFIFTKIQDPQVIAKLAANVNDLILNFAPDRESKIEKIRLKLFFVNHIKGVSEENLKQIKSAFGEFYYLSMSTDKVSLSLNSYGNFGNIVRSIDNYVGIKYQTPEMKQRTQKFKVQRQREHDIDVKNHKKEILTGHSSGCLISLVMFLIGMYLLSKASYSGSTFSWIGGILFLGSLIFAFFNEDR